ncbi:MAG: hypothetical protein ACTSP4_12300 [Candidatus Hodarchaeales archaeon]
MKEITLEFQSNLFSINRTFKPETWHVFRLELLDELGSKNLQYEALKLATRTDPAFKGTVVSFGHLVAILPIAEEDCSIDTRMNEIRDYCADVLGIDPTKVHFEAIKFKEWISITETGINLFRHAE